jgi:hypothetical protein
MRARLHELLGRVVHDVDGKRVGRIEGARAEIRGEECVITEWELGTEALLARLGLTGARLIGIPREPEPIRVPWDRLDVRNPKDVRLLCRTDEL